MVTRNIVNSIRLDYSTGSKDIQGLIARWVPQITAKDLEDVLAYKMFAEDSLELKTKISEMENLRVDIEKALSGQQDILAVDIGVADYMPEEYWKDTFELLCGKYSWLTKTIFVKVRNNLLP